MSFFWRQAWLYTVDWDEWDGEVWVRRIDRFLNAEDAGNQRHALRRKLFVRDICTSRRPIGVPRSTVV